MGYTTKMQSMLGKVTRIINGSLVPSGNHILVISILFFTLRYEGNGEVSATNLRHRQRDTKDSSTLLPSFKPTNQNITVHPGDRAVLRCRVENLGTKTVTWRKKGETNPLTIGYFLFSPDTRLSLDFNQRNKEWSLIIQAVKPEDEGLYHCQVTTKQDSELYYPIKLNVLTVQITGTDYVVMGSQLQLMCNATGKPDPPHNVEWYKDDMILKSNAERGIIITKKIETKVLVSMLVIKEIKMSDQATYRCRSSNQDAADFTLNVLDPVMTPNKDKRERERIGVNGQKNSPYRGTAVRGSSSSLHRKSQQHILTVVCLSVALMFLDTRWRS